MTQPPQDNNPYPAPGPNGEQGSPVPGANGYQAPNINGMPYYPGQQGFMPAPAVAPDAEEKLKRSQTVLLATMGLYLLTQIFGYILTPDTVEFMGQVTSSDKSIFSTLSGSILGVTLFILVYNLMNKRKKAGRIAGYVFAVIGCLASFLVFIGGLIISPVIAGLGLLWLASSIVWIVFVSNRSVSSILH